jgi:hypothetical protein
MKDNLDDIPMPHLLSINPWTRSAALAANRSWSRSGYRGSCNRDRPGCFSIASHPLTIANDERVLFDWNLRLRHRRPTIYFRMQKLGITRPQGACP